MRRKKKAILPYMLKPKSPIERVMVALDFDELEEAVSLIEALRAYPVTFKVGNQLGTYEGWLRVIQTIHSTGAKIFCDTKFKDIPATVERSCRAITRHQPEFFNIMADNSPAALIGAVKGRDQAVKNYGLKKKPVLLGVTVLTSITDTESQELYGKVAKEKVLQFATMAAQNGLDGVVCSPQEAALLKENESTSSLLLVTPGIRPEWAVAGDQSRVLSPADAVRAGSDYLVIGRPITKPPESVGSPADALERILNELEEM